MLNDTFHCIPPIAKNYQQFAPKGETTTSNCLKEGICMFQLSTRFCQAPFCWSDNAPLTQCKKQCESPVKTKKKTEFVKKICQQLDTVAIKTIRMNDITKLKPFYQPDYPLNFKGKSPVITGQIMKYFSCASCT